MKGEIYLLISHSVLVVNRVTFEGEDTDALPFHNMICTMCQDRRHFFGLAHDYEAEGGWPHSCACLAILRFGPCGCDHHAMHAPELREMFLERRAGVEPQAVDLAHHEVAFMIFIPHT